jgi:hypothetical protein
MDIETLQMTRLTVRRKTFPFIRERIEPFSSAPPRPFNKVLLRLGGRDLKNP